MFLFWCCSLNWQHQLCKNPRPNPDIKTLFLDHSCNAANGGARALTPVNLPVAAVARPSNFVPLGVHGGVRISYFITSPFYYNLNVLDFEN